MGAKTSKNMDTSIIEGALEESHHNDHEQKHKDIKE